MAKKPTGTVLAVEKRTEFGKGASRRIRRDHKIPAVLYGHGSEPMHFALPGHDTMMAVKQANAILTLTFDGEEQMALVKDVQRHPIKPVIHHIDLIIVKKGEKVVVDIPVNTTGDAASSALVTLENSTVQVKAEATHIPEAIEVSIEGLEVGAQILAKDLQLPDGTELEVDGETLIVNITEAPTADLDTPTADDATGDVPEVGDAEASADAEGASEN